MGDDPPATRRDRSGEDANKVDHTAVDLSYSTLRKVQYLLGPAICLIFGLVAIWAALSTGDQGSPVGLWVIATVALLAGIGLIGTGPRLFRQMRLIVNGAGITIELPQVCSFRWSELASIALSVVERREPMTLAGKADVFVDLGFTDATMAHQTARMLVRTDDPRLAHISLGRRKEVVAPVDAALRAAAPAQVYRGIVRRPAAGTAAQP